MSVLHIVPAILLILVLSACGDKSPIGPSPVPTPSPTPSPSPPPPPPTWTLSGRVTSNPYGQPVAGVNVLVEGLEPTQTDGAGTFSITSDVLGKENHRINLSAKGFINRGSEIKGDSRRNFGWKDDRNFNDFD